MTLLIIIIIIIIIVVVVAVIIIISSITITIIIVIVIFRTYPSALYYFLVKSVSSGQIGHHHRCTSKVTDQSQTCQHISYPIRWLLR